MNLWRELDDTRSRIEADVYRALHLIGVAEESRRLSGRENQQKLDYEELCDFLQHQQRRGKQG